MEYYEIPSFTRTNLVKHAFSGRKGGFSQGKYSTLNLSFFTEDKSDNVLENRRKFCTELGIDLDSIVCAEQVHGEHIYNVAETDQGRGAYNRDSAIPATDALITKDKGVALVAFC